MSKWTDARDSIVNDLQISSVTEQMRADLLQCLANEATPAVEAFLGKFTDAVKAEAEHESGWCRFRDAVVIPGCISLLLQLSKYAITRTLAETQTKQ
ncbi:MAG: hypothetical protein SOZ01_09090 [Selenomonadaceae bacterium]|nr:hypothetical protein [Selenomonadaceae bacterium]MDY3916872.1 hypothetical protein [Selenomonadaceae bacterium]